MLGPEARPFSLVLATVGRVVETRAFLASLGDGARVAEIVVVDQNSDDRLDSVLADFAHLPIRRIRHAPGNLSAARNAGMAVASAEILAFPDDDCTYPAGLLDAVAARFAAAPHPAMLTTMLRAPEGQPALIRWLREPVGISRHNAFQTLMAATLFVRRELAERIGGFDPRFGLGGRFGAAEETDFVMRGLMTGAVACYEPSLSVVHPDGRRTSIATARAFSYGLGMGACMRRHRFGIMTLLYFVTRSAAGGLYALLSGRMGHARYHAATFAGRLCGYLMWREAPAPATMVCRRDRWERPPHG